MKNFFKKYTIAIVVGGVVLMTISSVEAKVKPATCPAATAGESYGRSVDAYSCLVPEMQEKCDSIVEEFKKKTQSLREKILAKRIELQAIAQGKQPDRKVIQEISNEIAKLYVELSKEYDSMYEKLAKEVGIRGQYLHGSGLMHRHGMGYGMGYGPIDPEHVPAPLPNKNKK